jgi:threonine/homoserine/homoserine lactone efflux protein
MVGGETGVFTMAVAVAFGLGTFVEHSLVLFTLIRLTGAGYLVYLAYEPCWTAANSPFSKHPRTHAVSGVQLSTDFS